MEGYLLKNGPLSSQEPSLGKGGGKEEGVLSLTSGQLQLPLQGLFSLEAPGVNTLELALVLALPSEASHHDFF